MNFKEQINMPLFYFLLIYESDLDIEIDGIIGLSKGATYSRKEYSFLNQLSEKKIIKENYLLYDLFNNLFYISEIPSYLMNKKNISCYDDNVYSNFWRCEMNSIKIDNVPIFMNSKIIFDSGTNGIVFPIRYLDFFKNIISNNKILTKYECTFEKIENDNIYKFACNKKIDSKYFDSFNNFIEIFLEKNNGNKNNNNNSFLFNLLDLLEEDEEICLFSWYVFDRKDDILLGAPFFEKYPIMFNKDNNIITIFGEGNNLYKNIHKNNNKLKIFITLSLIFIFILLSLIIFRKLFFANKRIKNNQIEIITEENNENIIID